MSDTTAAPPAPSPVTPEGALRSDIYGRLVALHHGLATHALPDPELRRLALREVMDVLKLIAANPRFRAADDADHAEFERRQAQTA